MLLDLITVPSAVTLPPTSLRVHVFLCHEDRFFLAWRFLSKRVDVVFKF